MSHSMRNGDEASRVHESRQRRDVGHGARRAGASTCAAGRLVRVPPVATSPSPAAFAFIALVAMATLALPGVAAAQTAPSAEEAAAYEGLHAAAWHGDVDAIDALVEAGADVEARDAAGRTAAIVAAFASEDEALARLAAAGADLNALEHRDYDVVTIAAVANDAELMSRALALGARPDNVTSPYAGTALIAAAHLGHDDVVRRLAAAGAPLDHVNNLGWTALIEAVVLGDGGPDHVATVRALVDAGADRDVGDRAGVTPLEHARSRGYADIVAILEGG